MLRRRRVFAAAALMSSFHCATCNKGKAQPPQSARRFITTTATPTATTTIPKAPGGSSSRGRNACWVRCPLCQHGTSSNSNNNNASPPPPPPPLYSPSGLDAHLSTFHFGEGTSFDPYQPYVRQELIEDARVPLQASTILVVDYANASMRFSGGKAVEELENSEKEEQRNKDLHASKHTASRSDPAAIADAIVERYECYLPPHQEQEEDGGEGGGFVLPSLTCLVVHEQFIPYDTPLLKLLHNLVMEVNSKILHHPRVPASMRQRILAIDHLENGRKEEAETPLIFIPCLRFNNSGDFMITTTLNYLLERRGHDCDFALVSQDHGLRLHSSQLCGAGAFHTRNFRAVLFIAGKFLGL